MPIENLHIKQTNDLTEAFAIRRTVFVDEQGVTEAEEIDGKDEICRHWLAQDALGAVATLRVLALGDTAKIQRVAVLARARGTGVGAALMTHVLDDLARLGFTSATLGSQTDAIGFYERLGFTVHGPVYDDAGIPHRDMTRPLTD